MIQNAANETTPQATSLFDAAVEYVDPLNRITTSGYSAAGYQVLRVDARGNPTTYTVDAIGQTTGRL